MFVVSVVLVGGGLTIVTLTEQRDRRDADADLRRFAGNLTPGIAGVLGVNPPPPGSPASPPPSTSPLVLLDRNGRPVPATAGALPPPSSSNSPPPGVVRALVDSFNERGQSSTPAGQIVFVRAAAPQSGRRLILGGVPAGFAAMSDHPGGRTVEAAGRQWRLMVVHTPIGVTVEVAALAQSISARAAHLRTIVIWTGIVGLLLVLIGTVISSRVALRPLTVLTRKAARVESIADLDVKLRAPRQPREVALLAEELDGMLNRLDEAVAAREAALLAARRFAADAGHELRTPLQSVRANLDIAGRDDATTEQRRLALETAALQSDRLGRLVDGLQTLARGESGLIAPTADVDLGDIADGAVFAARTRHPELTIYSDLPASGPVVQGDADGLWRVVENLLENAARHGRPGGHVRLRVTATDAGAEIVVEDDGPGIPFAERERVVHRFARGRGTTTTGSGLGLSIVDAEARRHGGTLALSSSELGGLLARVTIGRQE
ncbi:MAG TPA: HAMP domain-containing sensor histidine kinase [Solirubrobacteraceae bacterium]|nr:HAMP domain-containing sensor histidine kinase [Solirubrobacteraceae bacterium]